MSRRRTGAFVALACALTAYYLLVDDLWGWSLWWDIGWVGLVLLPAFFGLVGLALPLWRARPALLIGLALACGALAVVCELADLHLLGNYAKLAAVTLGGWWFLGFFEELGWVVLVASIIPFVDAYSVWRGPTNEITQNHPDTFAVLSVYFPFPGGEGYANLGLPDLLFFAIFLGAAARFGLRAFWTWLAGVASFGLTMVLAVGFHADGLPALPLLSIGFLIANADLIWRRLRASRRPRAA